MTIDKTIANAQPDDPAGSWAEFWRAVFQPEPAPVVPAACPQCRGKGFYCSGGTTYRHCVCPAGEALRAGIVRRE